MTERKLEKLRSSVAAVHGDNSIMFANQVPIRPKVSSGSLALDFACGGGFPTDRVIEVAGLESSGKTSLALMAMRNFLDADPDRGALILDTEAKIDPVWMERLLGEERMEKVLLASPDHAEQATDIFTEMVGTGLISFVLYDSIGGAPTKKVTEKSAESAEYGGNAQAISRFARLASTYAHKYQTLVLGVNQVRADMEGFRRFRVAGGHAWLHACSLRIQLKRGQGKLHDKINGEEIQCGYQVTAKVIKNQIGGVEGRQAWWWLANVPTEKYGFGVDVVDEIARLSVLTGVIEQRGAYYYHPSFPGGKIQSRDRMVQCVKDDEGLRVLLTSAVMDRVNSDGGKYLSEIAPVDADEDSQ